MKRCFRQLLLPMVVAFSPGGPGALGSTSEWTGPFWGVFAGLVLTPGVGGGLPPAPPTALAPFPNSPPLMATAPSISIPQPLLYLFPLAAGGGLLVAVKKTLEGKILKPQLMLNSNSKERASPEPPYPYDVFLQIYKVGRPLAGPTAPGHELVFPGWGGFSHRGGVRLNTCNGTLGTIWEMRGRPFTGPYSKDAPLMAIPLKPVDKEPIMSLINHYKDLTEHNPNATYGITLYLATKTLCGHFEHKGRIYTYAYYTSAYFPENAMEAELAKKAAQSRRLERYLWEKAQRMEAWAKNGDMVWQRHVYSLPEG